jgi:hypothetical protein
VKKLLERLSDGSLAAPETGTPGESRFLAVVGPSGSGKSSVVKAGLVPALRQGGVADSESWYIVDMVPGAGPFEELEAALLHIAVGPPGDLLAQLKEDEQGILRAVGQILPSDADTELLLVIDQFEEVFTLIDNPSERTHFLDSLEAAVTDRNSRVRVVLTLRADFYDQPLMYPGFGELVRHSTEVILPLSSSELKRAIQGPLENVGVELEPGLTEVIVADVHEQPGSLPLLQYSLTELFERCQGRLLTQAAYQEIGGVLGALSRRAEELYLGLDDIGREAAHQLFLRLVTLGEGMEDTRRRVLRSELEALSLETVPTGEEGDGQVTGDDTYPTSITGRVIDGYGRHRLLSFDRDPATREPTVEVAHEALLREWQRLRAWLEESREDLRQQRRLGMMAREWQQAGQEASFLLRGSRLDTLEQWAKTTPIALTTWERAYLEASLAERAVRRAAEQAQQERQAALEKRSRRFLRALAGVLALATVVALALTSLAVSRSRLAEQNAGLANQNALVAQRNALTATVAQGQALAQAALAQEQKGVIETQAAEARQVADLNHHLALAAQSQLARQAGNQDLALALAMAAAEGNRPPPQSELALSLAAYDPGTVRVLTGHPGPVWCLAVSPDGRYALSGGGRNQTGTQVEDFSLRFWDLRTGAEIRRFEGHTDGVTQVAFTPDARFALSASLDRTLILWDVPTGRLVRRLEGHQAPVR